MLHDREAGDLLEQEERMFAFLSEIIVAARKALAKAPKLFSFASTYAFGAVAQKRTQDCFTSKLWYYRDRDFDNWLPIDQSNIDAGNVTVLTPMKSWTFAEAAVSILNVSPDTPIATLGKLLIERGHTMTLTQVEAMVEATERGEKTGMVTNGYGNFFFVENADSSVSVAGVDRGDDDRPWHAGVYGLAFSGRWRAVGRLVVCNLDPSKLGL